MIEIRFTANTVEEYRAILQQLVAGDIAAAKTHEASTGTHTKTADEMPKLRHEAAPAEAKADTTAAPAQPEQVAQDAPFDAGQGTVPLADIQALGRKLAAAGKGNAVQAVLKAHGVKLMSRIPEADRAAVLAELKEAE